MSCFPDSVRSVSTLGEVRYSLGDPLVDSYLEFVAARCRPNALRAVTPDLKVFFTVVTRAPVEVAAPDVFEHLAHQRRDRRWCGRPLTMEGLDEFVAGTKHRAGLERRTCHQLRHTCLTRLRQAGMALEAVQAQAGHRSTKSTRIYLHLTNDWLAIEYQLAVQRIDADTAAELLAMQDIPRAPP